MQDEGEPANLAGGVSKRLMDIIVAALMMLFGAVVMVESYELGAGWSPTGPESGYFPFYVGLLILVSSTATVVATLFTRSPDRASFVEPRQFKLVLQVLIPATVFVVAISYIGIYVAGGLFIAFFMWWLGKYPLHIAAPVSVLIPVALFFLFEVWFLISLPKGPLENFLGY